MEVQVPDRVFTVFFHPVQNTKKLRRRGVFLVGEDLSSESLQLNTTPM